MMRDIPHLQYSANVVASISEVGPLPLASMWKAFRTVSPTISLHEIKSSIKEKHVIALPSFDATDVEIFIRQLHALNSFHEQIQSNQLPIRLMESRSQQCIDERILSGSIQFHVNNLFKITAPVNAFLEQLKQSQWIGKPTDVLPSNYRNIVHDPPSTLNSLSEIMFAISTHIRQGLDDAGFHPDTLAHCYRTVGERFDDDEVRRKFANTIFANRSDFCSLIASVVKLACAQLFYEEPGPKEFVEWCNHMCRGLIPVGWHGETRSGKLLLYELDNATLGQHQS